MSSSYFYQGHAVSEVRRGRLRNGSRNEAEKAEAIRMGCKVVGGRWVDVDKGDTTRPDYRSRFVAKEKASTAPWRSPVAWRAMPFTPRTVADLGSLQKKQRLDQ